MGGFDGHDDDGADRDPDPTDLERWRERQRALNEVYGQGTDAIDSDETARLEPITRSLAKLLWSFHDDGPLWRQLRKQQVTLEGLDDEQRIRILAAADIDWVPFLLESGYRPPPAVETLADEFRLDIRRALGNGRGLDTRDLRARVADLATLLDLALADERPGAVAKLRASLRLSLPAVGRAALVNGVAAAATVGAGALFGATAVLAPFAPIGGAVAGGATRAALDRALPKWGTPADDRPFDARRSSAEVGRLIRDGLRPDLAGRHAATLNLLSELAETCPAGTSLLIVAHEYGQGEALRDALDWIDRTLGTVFVAWEQAADADMSTAGLARLADRLSRARRVLSDLGVNEPGLRDLANAITADIVAILSELPPDHGLNG
ncbi:hypothetical protein [Kribbella sp. NBC_00359]|uniref:hypothetical protein n=1 Tax=Kribbella sp. NBC_00359 TaxID=2975966 RepID=UPI002E23373E